MEHQMTGTETAAAGGWLIGKLAPAIGGLFGGLSLAMFWTPEKLRQKGKIASIFIAGGISAMAGFSFTGIVAVQIGIDPQKIDIIIGLSWALGLLSIAVMNWIANYMARREHLDIAEIGREIKSVQNGEQTRIRRIRKPSVRTTKAGK
jgi:hypothetical protein